MYYPIDVKALKEMTDKAAVKEAEAKADHLKENYPGWKDELPDCPCTQEEIDEQSDIFERSDYGLETHHSGAASGYRSSEPVEIKSTVNPELTPLEAGQQCTFDTQENLITHGVAAGTPDAYSPSEIGNILDHYQTDVFTSQYLSSEEYLKEWTPNNNNDCPENWGDNVSKPEKESEPENPQPNLDKNPESDRNSPENTQPKAETSPEAEAELGTDGEEELGADLETQAWDFESFNDEDEAVSVTSESFWETDSFEIESFAEASSDSFEPFSESSSGSFESFAESSAGESVESYSESVAEMG